ncbi:MAG: hypothetical protein WC700_14385 [Gemmatimonadaceae bacterium]|jgi:hypothetical protein
MPATFASADLLSRFNTYAGRPASGDALTDATKYQYLADAQNEVIADIASRAPWTLYSKAAAASTPTCSTSDNKIFTFGNDVNGNPLFPMGKTMIYPSLDAIPDSPWREGWDYLNEGTQIRIPNNGTYAGTLYWRGIAPVLDISSTNQPALLPVNARLLIVYKAVWDYAESGMRNQPLADRYAAKYNARFPEWMLVWKTAFANGGALETITGRDLAIIGIGGGSAI